MTQGLTIDGHVLQAQGVRQELDPTLEATQKGLGIEAIKEAFKSVMGGDAVGEGQKRFEPVVTPLAESDDLLPVVGAADHGRRGR